MNDQAAHSGKNIERRELRIGNLVLVSDQVAEIPNGMFIDEHWDAVSGIPMTPEWLNKLDIKFSEGLGYSYPFAENFNLYLTKRVLRSVECTVMQYSQGDERLAHIECVHQFQNLYFALTGKELEIKK